MSQELDLFIKVLRLLCPNLTDASLINRLVERGVQRLGKDTKIWRCSFLNLRSSEIHLFYNLGDFYWHFLEILWLFIFLFLYSLYLHVFHILFIFISLAFWPFNDNFIFFIFGKLSPSNGRSITILVVSSCLSLLWNLHLVSLAKRKVRERHRDKTTKS